VIPQLLFVRFVGAITACCSAAIIVEVNVDTGIRSIFCGGCLNSAPFVPFPAVRMGLTEEWAWREAKLGEAIGGHEAGILRGAQIASRAPRRRGQCPSNPLNRSNACPATSVSS